MPRVANKQTPAKAKVEEEIQTLTQSRSRRTPKPNPKYANESIIPTPKFNSRAELEEDEEEDPPAITPTPSSQQKAVVKKIVSTKIVPKKEVLVVREKEKEKDPVVSETRATRSRPAQVIESKEQKAKTPAVVPKKQKLDFDKDDDEDDEEKASPAPRVTRATRSNEGAVVAPATREILTKIVAQKTPASNAVKVVKKVSSPAATQLKGDKKASSPVTVVTKKVEEEKPNEKEKDQAVQKDDSFVTFVDINAIMKKDKEKEELAKKSITTDASPAEKSRIIVPAKSKISPQILVKEKAKVVSPKFVITSKANPGASKFSPMAIGTLNKTPSPTVIGSIRRKPLEEVSPAPKRFKTATVTTMQEEKPVEMRKVILKRSPTAVLVKKASPVATLAKPQINNGKFTKLPAQQPRILNSSVMAATKQSSTVKLLNSSTANNKFFSIDMTDDENSDNTASGGAEPKKATIVQTLAQRGLKNTSNLLNKSQIHENLNKSLKESLKSFRESNNNNNRIKLSPTAASGTPSPLQRVMAGRNERITQVGNTQKVTKFESWYIIDCPKLKVEQQKHAHSLSLMTLGNALKDMTLPEKWEYKVSLQKKPENNATEEIYTGEITDTTISEEQRTLYEPSNIIIKRSMQKSPNRATIDRSVNIKEDKYVITIDGRNCCLVGAPEDITNVDEFAVLFDILDTVTLENSCVESTSTDYIL